MQHKCAQSVFSTESLSARLAWQLWMFNPLRQCTPLVWVSHSQQVQLSLEPATCCRVTTLCCQQELDPAAASLIRGLAASQAASGAAPITLIDGLAVHKQYLQPLLPHPEVRLTSWVAKVHALCWVTSFQQVRTN
jgi:hypothetical protein